MNGLTDALLLTTPTLCDCITSLKDLDLMGTIEYQKLGAHTTECVEQTNVFGLHLLSFIASLLYDQQHIGEAIKDAPHVVEGAF